MCLNGARGIWTAEGHASAVRRTTAAHLHPDFYAAPSTLLLLAITSLHLHAFSASYTVLSRLEE